MYFAKDLKTNSLVTGEITTSEERERTFNQMVEIALELPE